MQKIIVDVLEKDPRVASYPEPRVYFTDFAASALNFEARFWIHNVLEQFQIRSDLRYAMNEAFRAHGVKIPYPQTDINLNSPIWDMLAQDTQKETHELISKKHIQKSRALARRRRHRPISSWEQHRS